MSEQEKGQPSPEDIKTPKATPKTSGKEPYEPPQIESTEVFESFTLQSCNQFPQECGGALE